MTLTKEAHAAQLRQVVADNIQGLLRLRGESTHSIAAKAKVSQKLVYSSSRGVHSPTIENLDKIARALGTDVRALLTRFEMISDLDRSSRIIRCIDDLLALSPGDREAVLSLIARFSPEDRSQ